MPPSIPRLKVVAPYAVCPYHGAVTIAAAPLRSARAAVSVLFFVNGALLASYLPRLPAVKSELDLTNAALGSGIAFWPAGALLASSVAGRAVAWLGSGRLGVAASVVAGLTLPLVGVAPIWGAFAAAVFLLGVCDGLADVAQNAHGLRVQHAYRRSIINGFHAWWSIGGIVGALAATVAAAMDMPVRTHLALAGGALALIVLAAGRWMLPGPDPGVTQSGEGPGADPGDGRPAGVTRSRPPGLALGGVVALTVALIIVEDVPMSWGAVYLRDELGTSAGLAGLAVVAATTGLTLGRLLADRPVDRWGHMRVVQASACLASVGMAVALVIGVPWVLLLGFACAGLGAAPAIPAAFHAAGHRPGIRPASGVALVSWSMRIGLLISPLVVGVVADTIGLTWAMGLGVIAGLAVVLGAPALRAR